jgi:hypothetical protein
MKNVFLTLILLLVSFSPAQADEKRIQRLEILVEDLNRRLAVLETSLIDKSGSASTTSNPNTTSSEGFKDRNNWRKLRTGMTPNEVERILGVAPKVDGGSISTWYYSSVGYHSYVVFFNNVVQRWTEPD